jgi:MFS family permease
VICSVSSNSLYGRGKAEERGDCFIPGKKAKGRRQELIANPIHVGRRNVLLSALALLTVSDLLCGHAKNDIMLYAFRGLSGVANGGIASLSAMIVSDIVTLKDRPKWQGIIGGFVGMGQMCGPFIAAGFVQMSIWRGFFWLVSPFAACCGVLVVLSVPATHREQPKRNYMAVLKQIDFLGILTGSVALILVLIPVAGGGDYFEWEHPMVVSFLSIGGCFFLAFIFVETKVAVLPMLPRTYPPPTPSSVSYANANQQASSGPGQ